jgi:hypothetical protein
MQTHQVKVYRCITCGRLTHADSDAAPPECCGHTMTFAFGEAMDDCHSPGASANGLPDTPPAAGKKQKREPPR